MTLKYLETLFNIISMQVGNYTCRNGDLQINEMNNIVETCVNGVWKKLCLNWWQSAQAEVACRQLNPGKMITSKYK